MKLPDKCPQCGVSYTMPTPVGMGSGTHYEVNYLIQRTDLDYDSEDQTRIEDQIFECSKCHTLFRARWELKSFVQLEEKP